MAGPIGIQGNIRMQTGNAVEKRITDAAVRRSNSGKMNAGFEKMLSESIKDEPGEKLPSKKIDKRLMDVCIEMESLMVARMFKEMRKTVHKNEWFHGGFAEEIFEDMLYDEYALDVSKNSKLGLAKMLYDELSGRR